MSGPIDRPIASRGPRRTRRSEPHSAHLAAAKVTAPASPSRISAHYLDVIAHQLTASDQATLLLLAEARLCTGQQLARWLWSSQSPTDANARAARRALARLETWRVIDRLAHRIGGVRRGSASIVYCLGPAGRKLLVRRGYEARRLFAPGERYIIHTLSKIELCVRLHQAMLDGKLDVIECQMEPSCWRSFIGMMGAAVVLKPDLFLRIGVGALEDRWFIEVDLATESVPTLTAKAKRYLAHFKSGEEQRRHGIYPRVIWTAPDPRRAEQIREALDRLPKAAKRLFVIWDYDEVIGRLAAEATP